MDTPSTLLRTDISLGTVTIQTRIENNELASIGAVRVGGTQLRNPATRWLPWFDSYDGDTFRRFEFLGIESRGDTTVLRTRAWSDPDTLFRERRDSSGDLCFRNANWDAPPLQGELSICFESVETSLDGRVFNGFKYWYEYSGELAIHRLVDRQTWEIGGNLDDLTLVCRNWLTPPRMRIARETEYSTVGLNEWASLLPGNLWGRWSLLPAFDMQYGAAGVLLGWFDEVSLIRTVIESNPGEDCVRCIDMHGFEQATQVRTNAKTIVRCTDVLDDVDVLNLWTRLHDREAEKARRQFDIPEEAPPAIIMGENAWNGVRFDHTYERVLEVAAEVEADYIFIDPVWEHQQAFKETLNELVPSEKQKGTILEKFWHQNQCVTLDFEVAEVLGGERGLRALCERAAQKDVGVLSWMAIHYSPNSVLGQDSALGHGGGGIFAAKESGRHPDTGYPASCWTANLNAPIYDKMKQQLLGVCERTGLRGFLWDSFCNIGWFQIDYSNGTMRPQFDKIMELYSDLTKQGLYILPEAIVAFSSHSCCGLHGGDVYAGDLLGYSYKSNIEFWFGKQPQESYESRVITGAETIDTFFRCIAHQRVPVLHFHRTPSERWHPDSVQEVKQLLRLYKQFRHLMQERTVLHDDAGVLWRGEGQELFFCFHDHLSESPWTDAVTGKSEQRVRSNSIYLREL